MVEAEDRFAEKRRSIFEASLEARNTPGWGYFGLTGCLGIGDNSYAPRLTKKPPPEEGAEPIRNIVTAPVKGGFGPDAYFAFETPVSLGDPYIDPGLRDKKGRQWMLDPEAVFKPPGNIKRGLNKLGFDYIDHCDTAKDPKEIKEKYKDYMPPRQIYTNPCKKGGGGVLTQGVLFGFGEERKFPEHVPDDFDAPRKIRLEEMKEHRSKLQEAPFKGIDYGNRCFGTNTDTYHCDIEKANVPRDKAPEDTSRRYPHEAAFRPSHPSRKGALKGCLGDFPQWKEDPEKPKVFRKNTGEEGPPAWKAGAPVKVCNPMPSVVTNSRNMRNERPMSFARPML